MKCTFAAIGLGACGGTVARALVRLGHDLRGIDSHTIHANDIADGVTQAMTVAIGGFNFKIRRALGRLRLHGAD